MKWYKAEGTQQLKPLELDTTSSPTTIYYRRNIERIEATKDEQGKWVYDEASQDKEEYNRQQAELTSPATLMIMQNIAALELQNIELQIQLDILSEG